MMVRNFLERELTELLRAPCEPLDARGVAARVVGHVEADEVTQGQVACAQGWAGSSLPARCRGLSSLPDEEKEPVDSICGS